MATSDKGAQTSTFVRRWLGFVVAIWLMAFSGSYGFPNYSTALKRVLGLNQKQLNRLSVAKDLGDSSGVIAGVLSNFVPPPGLLCIGAVVSVVGNGIQWLVVKEIIATPPLWVMFIVAAVAGNTMSWLNTSVMTLSMRNFPRNRGPVAGILKAYMGLSAAIYAHFCDNFFSSSEAMYLLMLMTVPPTFCLITAMFFRPVPPSETVEDEVVERKSIVLFTILSIALAVTLIVKNVVPSLQEGIGGAVPTVLLFVLLAAPALVPVVLFFKVKRNTADGSCVGEESNGLSGYNGKVSDFGSRHVEKEEVDLRRALLEKQETAPNGSDCEKSCSGTDHPQLGCVFWPSLQLGDDWSTVAIFKKWHTYVLFATLFFGTGCGMSFSNNLGQVSQSFGFSSVMLFTSLFSLGNFFGRIASGTVSEFFLKMMGTPRPTWIGVAKLPMIAFFIWLSFGSAASLFAGSFIVGFSHGSLITLTIPTISEFYGLKYFGTNYMVLNIHILLGSTVFSGIIAGYLYDHNATDQASDGSLNCYGAACYGTTFRVYASCLALALFLDVILTFASRHLYRHLKVVNTMSQDKTVQGKPK